MVSKRNAKFPNRICMWGVVVFGTVGLGLEQADSLAEPLSPTRALTWDQAWNRLCCTDANKKLIRLGFACFRGTAHQLQLVGT